MKLFIAAACLSLAACAKPADESQMRDAAAINAATVGASYEPMAPFAPISGSAYRSEWSDPNGEAFVDIAKYEMILNGRALQSTHRLEGKDYGGRTIFFYDEGAKKYVFHYFTTGGFHTSGTSEFSDGALVSDEKVEGHETIASVRSKAVFGADEILVDVVYVGKDGTQSPGGHRVYRKIADPGRLFADTE